MDESSQQYGQKEHRQMIHWSRYIKFVEFNVQGKPQKKWMDIEN